VSGNAGFSALNHRQQDSPTICASVCLNFNQSWKVGQVSFRARTPILLVRIEERLIMRVESVSVAFLRQSHRSWASGEGQSSVIPGDYVCKREARK